MTGSALFASIARVEFALLELNRLRLFDALRPPQTAPRTGEILAKQGLISPGELEVVYGWRDSTEAEGALLDDIQMFPGFYLLSSGDALHNYEAFVEDARWQRGWWPVFANGGGDFYVQDLDGPGATAMRRFRIEESDHPVEFESLTKMFATLAQCYEERIVYVDPEGYLDMNDERFAGVARRLNPRVQWWTS